MGPQWRHSDVTLSCGEKTRNSLTRKREPRWRHGKGSLRIVTGGCRYLPQSTDLNVESFPSHYLFRRVRCCRPDLFRRISRSRMWVNTHVPWRGVIISTADVFCAADGATSEQLTTNQRGPLIKSDVGTLLIVRNCAQPLSHYNKARLQCCLSAHWCTHSQCSCLLRGNKFSAV